MQGNGEAVKPFERDLPGSFEKLIGRKTHSSARGEIALPPPVFKAKGADTQGGLTNKLMGCEQHKA